MNARRISLINYAWISLDDDWISIGYPFEVVLPLQSLYTSIFLISFIILESDLVQPLDPTTTIASLDHGLHLCLQLHNLFLLADLLTRLLLHPLINLMQVRIILQLLQVIAPMFLLFMERLQVACSHL